MIFHMKKNAINKILEKEQWLTMDIGLKCTLLISLVWGYLKKLIDW